MAPFVKIIALALALDLALCAGASTRSVAQTAAQSPAQTAPAAAAAQSPKPVLPSPEGLFVLIRGTLAALHHGNLTGNYTVFRDLAAPGFQARNTASDLARIFTDLRTRRVDLGAALLLTPEITQGPVISDAGMMDMVGIVPTAPERIAFRFVFQPVDGVWRMFGVAIETVPAPAAPAPAAAEAPKPADAKAADAKSAKAAPPAKDAKPK